MTSAEGALSSAGHATMEAGEEVLNILFEWIVPIITLLVGFYIGGSIGLSGAIYSLLDGVIPSSVSNTALIWSSDLVAAAIFAAIAGGMWHVAGGGESLKGANVRKWILRPLATLVGGFALSELKALMGKTVNTGALGTVANQMSVKVGA